MVQTVVKNAINETDVADFWPDDRTHLVLAQLA